MTDLTMSQFASKDDLIAAQAARIAELEKENSYLNNACAELEAQLEAIGAGGVEPLRKPASQLAVQAAVPEGWKWMSIPSRCGGAIMPVRVFEEDGVKYYQPFDWENETAFEWDKRSKGWVEHEVDAPAHPAEGVPAQAAVPTDDELTMAWIAAGGLFFGQNTPTGSMPEAKLFPFLRQLAAPHPTQQGLDAQTEAARSVLAERARQVAAKGWTPDLDDEYTRGILGEAGGIYALHAFDPRRAKEVPEGWPWDDAWWKPKDPRTNLVKAGALILAEIERMDRSFAAQAKQGGADHG